MKRRQPWFFSTVLVFVATAGCQPKTATPPRPQAVPPSGCRVERLEAAEQAVRQLFEHSEAYVYSIDGDLASCKLEVFYKPDEASQEQTIFSASGDSVVDTVRAIAEAEKISLDKGNNHHVLSIVVPECPPKPDDKYMFSFSIRSTSNADGKEKNSGCSHRKSEDAAKILPASLLGVRQNFISVSGPLPVPSRNVMQGEEVTLVHATFFRIESEPSNDPPQKKLDSLPFRLTQKKLDLLRWCLTVKCVHAVQGMQVTTDPAAAQRELAKWEGTWETGYGATMTIKGDCWTSKAPGSAEVSGKLNVIEIRPTLTLVDLLVEEGEKKGETCEMILRLEGDTLHYCGTYSETRPTEFKSTYENQNIYYAWKRTRNR